MPSLSTLAPYAAALISLVIAIIADRRARKAQREQVQVDRAKLINEAYQGIMDELREELKRIAEARVEDQAEYKERIEQLEREIEEEGTRRTELEQSLAQERDKTEALEQRLWALEQRLAHIKRKYGIDSDPGPTPSDNGDDDSEEETA